jgi:hypothetical protein
MMAVKNFNSRQAAHLWINGQHDADQPTPAAASATPKPPAMRSKEDKPSGDERPAQVRP